MILLATCLVILAFTLTEKPWSTSEMNKLALANESLFYVLLVLILASPSLTTETERDNLGWAMITVVTLAIHTNLVAMLA